MEVTLYIDTCNKYMSVGLSKNGELIYKKQYEAFRKQSEYAALEIKKCLDESKVKASEITRIVVGNGPGSYTGIRIGLTLAKVMAKALNIELVTLSSLNIIAGTNKKALAIIDARSNRAYVGFYNNGKKQKEDSILTLDELNKVKDKYNLYGDTLLVGEKEIEVDIVKNMFELNKINLPVKEIDGVKAIYLKD